MTQVSRAQRIYCIGIKGVGMTGLAQILTAQGKEVWGSDTPEVFFTNEVLRHAGIRVLEGFSADHLDQPIDLVIRSTAYADDHVEVAAARERGLPVLAYAEALGEITQVKSSLAVAGSHGKTTTTALLAHVLKLANFSPTALVGSHVPQFGGNALVGSSELFVHEADEYQNKLQYFKPHGVILTSIQWDHPDFFPTPEEYLATFVQFIKSLPADGFVIACYDDPEVKRAISQADLRPEQIVAYGLQHGALRLVRMWLDEGRWHFSVKEGEEFLGDFWLRLIGAHNVANALAVIACAKRLGVSLDLIRQGLASFEGTARRFEFKGKLTNGLTLVDDYAHHPAEISATLKAARAFYPYKRIRCIFQPHTFSRTAALLKEFATCFGEADEVIVVDTYASAREQGGAVTSIQLADEIASQHSNVRYIPTLPEATRSVSETASRSDLVITMGAGDVWQIGEQLIKQFGTVTGNDSHYG